MCLWFRFLPFPAGDKSKVKIGAHVHVGDKAVINTVGHVDTGFSAEVAIESWVVIEPGAVLTSCMIGNRCIEDRKTAGRNIRRLISCVPTRGLWLVDVVTGSCALVFWVKCDIRFASQWRSCRMGKKVKALQRQGPSLRAPLCGAIALVLSTFQFAEWGHI